MSTMEHSNNWCMLPFCNMLADDSDFGFEEDMGAFGELCRFLLKDIVCQVIAPMCGVDQQELHLAIVYNDIAKTLFYLDKVSDVNDAWCANNLIRTIIKHSYLDMMKTLIKHSLIIKQFVHDTTWSHILEAAKYHQTEFVRYLFDILMHGQNCTHDKIMARVFFRGYGYKRLFKGIVKGLTPEILDWLKKFEYLGLGDYKEIFRTAITCNNPNIVKHIIEWSDLDLRYRYWLINRINKQAIRTARFKGYHSIADYLTNKLVQIKFARRRI